jgi:hypothetical protein
MTMRSAQYCIATRRQAIVGASSLIATMGIGSRAIAFTPWWTAFSAATAAGWLVEALKNWGLVPEAKASTSVQGAHGREAAPLLQQGYSVRPMYSGAYSGGDFELSEARQGEDFLALGTTSHGSNTCTLKFDKADTINLGLVATALRHKGFDPHEVEAAALPIHPPSANQFIANRRQSPTYMTPSHGTITWSTDVSDIRPNLATSIRSGIVNADLRFARLDSGRWTFDMRRV